MNGCWLKTINMQCTTHNTPTMTTKRENKQYLVKNHIQDTIFERESQKKSTPQFCVLFLNCISFCSSPHRSSLPPLNLHYFAMWHCRRRKSSEKCKKNSLSFLFVITSLYSFMSCIAFIVCCIFYGLNNIVKLNQSVRKPKDTFWIFAFVFLLWFRVFFSFRRQYMKCVFIA